MSENIPQKKSLNPWSNDEFCHICREVFTINNVRKTCGHCGNFVCVDHSAKKRWADDILSRMCDRCRFNKTRFFLMSQNAPKIEELQKEIERISQENDRLSQGIKDLKISRKELDAKLKELKRTHEKTCSILEPRVNDMLEQNERLDYVILNFNPVIEESKRKIQEGNIKSVELEIEMKKYEEERDIAKQEVQSLSGNIKKLDDINKASIVIPAIKSCMCDECKIKIYGAGSIGSDSEQNKNQKCNLF